MHIQDPHKNPKTRQVKTKLSKKKEQTLLMQKAELPADPSTCVKLQTLRHYGVAKAVPPEIMP